MYFFIKERISRNNFFYERDIFLFVSDTYTYISLVKFTLHKELYLLLDLTCSQRLFMRNFLKFGHSLCNAVSKSVLQQETQDGRTDRH